MDQVLTQVTMSTTALCDALEGLDLDEPTLLPGWSRLTVVCHLRYGAEAMRWMTLDTVAGRETSYYPEGRATQRPGTLEPRPGESHADVVRSLREASAALDDAWRRVTDWDITVVEPADNVDLGPYPLAHMPLFRLTEIEVHGTDLDIGLRDWSDVLIDHGLSMRLERLARRVPQASGAWLIRGTRIGDDAQPDVIDGTDRQLFALTLGRWSPSESFSRAYPGP